MFIVGLKKKKSFGMKVIKMFSFIEGYWLKKENVFEF